MLDNIIGTWKWQKKGSQNRKFTSYQKFERIFKYNHIYYHYTLYGPALNGKESLISVRKLEGSLNFKECTWHLPTLELLVITSDYSMFIKISNRHLWYNIPTPWILSHRKILALKTCLYKGSRQLPCHVKSLTIVKHRDVIILAALAAESKASWIQDHPQGKRIPK